MAEFEGRIDLGYRNTDIHEVTGFQILGMVPPKYYNTYVVTICFMEGDADGYQYEEVVIKDEQTLKEFVDFCFRCAVAYPHGKGGLDNYEHVAGYRKFVGDCYHEYDEKYDEEYPEGFEGENFLEGWPTVEWEYFTSFDWFKVEYYGATGQACTVKVITEVKNDKETGGVSS